MCPWTLVVPVTELQKHRDFTACVVTAHNAVVYVQQSCCFIVAKLIGITLLPRMITEGIIKKILIFVLLHSFCISREKLANIVLLVSINEYSQNYTNNQDRYLRPCWESGNYFVYCSYLTDYDNFQYTQYRYTLLMDYSFTANSIFLYWFFISKSIHNVNDSTLDSYFLDFIFSVSYLRQVKGYTL